MPQAQARVTIQHAGSGMAHHHLDLVTPGALITMNGAMGASWFFPAESATIQSQGRVRQQFAALRTKPGALHRAAGPPSDTLFCPRRDGGLMLIAAIEANHRLERLPFALQPFCRERFCCFQIVDLFHSGDSHCCVHVAIMAQEDLGVLDASQCFE